MPLKKKNQQKHLLLSINSEKTLHVYMLSHFRLCPTLQCYGQSDCSVHCVLQARILERAAMRFSRGFAQARNQICISCLQHWLAGSSPLAPPGKSRKDFTWGLI